MKPLLIIPPCAARWHALQDLLAHKGPPWLEDIEQRFAQGVAGARDAFAVVPNGGQFVAHACINAFGHTGVLGHVFTRPDHRRRGYALQLLKTVLSWFNMVGGKRIYLGTTVDLAEPLYGKFGFKIIRRTSPAPSEGGAGAALDRVMMMRVADGQPEDPLADMPGEVAVREVGRAEWPLIVALLQHRPGPDPRVSLDETAVAAEAFVLELINGQARGTCALRAAFRGPQVFGFASVATDQLGERTYAVQMPHNEPLPALREAIVELARTKGYTQVDFPMEALAAPPETTSQM